jgi:hypothetical protein
MAESATSVGSLTLVGLFAMISQPSILLFRMPEALQEHPLQSRYHRRASHGDEARPSARLVRHIQVTSYWLRDAKEMAGVNTILIIPIHR